MTEENYKKIFNLKPVRILCPICGTEHKYNGKKLNTGQLYEYSCNGYLINFWGNTENVLHVSIYNTCRAISRTSEIREKIFFEQMQQAEGRPVVKCKMNFVPLYNIAREPCYVLGCEKYANCKILEYVRRKRNELSIREPKFYNDFEPFDGVEYEYGFEFGFEFDIDEFELCMNDLQDKDIPDSSIVPVQTLIPNQPQMTLMPENMNISQRLLYCSPMQNLEMLKLWLTKNKKVVKWLISLGGIYGAYKIISTKNDKFSIENIGNLCMENFGFVFEPLKDKDNLGKFSKIATSYVGTYFLTKIVFKQFATKTKNKSFNNGDIDDGIKQIDNIRSHDSLSPQMEEVLPIAISIIVVFLVNNPFNNEKIDNFKSKLFEGLGDFAYKLEALLDLVKCFIADKLNLDLSIKEDEEKFKKFTALAIISIILIYLYGNKEAKNNNKIQGFVKQILETTKNIAPSAFGVIVALLVENKIVNENDVSNLITNN